MLIKKPLAADDIISLKLSNGDELIAKFVEQTTSTITVSRPVLMVLTQDQRTGQPGVQMVPFFMLGGEKDGQYPINSSHVVCMVVSNSEAKKGYLEVTTSLAIPKAGASLIA